MGNRYLSTSDRRRRAFRHSKFSRHGSAIRELALDRVPQMHPATPGAGNCPFHHDQTTIDVNCDHFNVLDRHSLIAELPGHFLVFERLARILALTGRTMRAMTD